MCSSGPRSLLRWQIEPFLNLDLDYLALNIDVTSDTLNIHNVGAICNYRKERRGEMEVYEKRHYQRSLPKAFLCPLNTDVLTKVVVLFDTSREFVRRRNRTDGRGEV